MKQDEVKVGKTYLFATTTIEHRKDLIGTHVTIAKKIRKGRGKAVVGVSGLIYASGGHIVLKTTTGRKVAPCELELINNHG